MFDFHIHSTVSYDGKNTAIEMALAAKEKGLKEICFTDHIDRDIHKAPDAMTFRTEDYNLAYDNLEIPGLMIRKGIEFGMKPDNAAQFSQELKRRPFDFVLGSVHYVGPWNAYKEDYWRNKTLLEAESRFLEETLTCIQIHDNFDVLAHLNFLSKSPCNISREPMHYKNHAEILDEILKVLVRKGKGLELNTSGFKRDVGFLPSPDYFQRFKELGGEIVTIGSDAHTCDKVGDHIPEACCILKEIFGYVCTFQDRQPVFHKL